MTQEERFVGRKVQREAFKRRLKDPYDDDRLESILGIGGIGKTWLVKEMLSDAGTIKTKDGQQYLVPELIDMYATEHRDIEGVLAAIAQRLQIEVGELFKDHFSRYQEAQTHLEEFRMRSDYSQEGLDAQLKKVQRQFLNCLREFVSQQPIVLAFDTLEVIYNTPVYDWLLDRTGLQMPGIICIFAGRPNRNVTTTTLALPPLSNDEALDMYHRYQPVSSMSEEEIEWVKTVNEKSRGNPLLLGLAISWLDQSDLDLSSDRIKKLSDHKFRKEIIDFLGPKGINTTGPLFPTLPAKFNQPLRQTLVFIAYLNRRFNKQFLDKLIENNYIFIVQGDEFWNGISVNLSDWFYIKERSGDDIQLHDILAEMIRVFILPSLFSDDYRLPDDLEPSLSKLVWQDIPNWYDEFIINAEDNHQKQLLRAEKLTYVLNTQVWQDTKSLQWAGTAEAKALAATLKPDFKRGLALLETYYAERSDVLDRFVLNELPSAFVEEFPLEMRYQVCNLLGEMALRIYDLSKSVTFWEIATETAQQLNDAPKQIEAIIGQHNSTWQQGPQQSLELLRQAELLCEQAPHLRPRVFYELGFTYRQMHNLIEAVQWFDRAKAEAVKHNDLRRLAFILNDMGFAYSFMGNHTRSYILVESARKNRQEQLKNVSGQQSGSDKSKLIDAQRQLGLTFNTMGLVLRHTDDLARASAEHSEALHYFNLANDNFWIMRALYERSDVHRRIAKTLYDTERKQAAYEYDQRANEDIQQSLATCERYGYVQELDTIHRRLGRLAHDRFFREDVPRAKLRRLEEAKEHFDKALGYAKETRDISEKLENLKEIAFLGDDRIALTKAHFPERLEEEMARSQKYIQMLEDGLEEHRHDEFQIYHFPVYENLLITEKAARYYALGEFNEALELYIRGFTGLARWPGYGVSYYHALKEHLFNSISNLESPILKRHWCESISNAWHEFRMEEVNLDASTIPPTLAEVHPDLIEWCKLHMEINL